MTPPPDENAWKRLGRLLAQRRVEIGARYRNKNLFAAERELNRRMVWSVENGVRDTYGRETLRAVEAAYMLAPGSLDRTLAGGPLEPAEEPRSSPRPVIVHSTPGAEEKFIASVLELLSPLDRQVIRDINRMTDEEGNPWTWEQKLTLLEPYVAAHGRRRTEAG